jgi:hypothetical protein
MNNPLQLCNSAPLHLCAIALKGFHVHFSCICELRRGPAHCVVSWLFRLRAEVDGLPTQQAFPIGHPLLADSLSEALAGRRG